MFSRQDLKTLIDAEKEPAISLFLPTHEAGREIRQDPIRLKNLLGDAEAKLIEAGHRGAEVRDWLAPARALVDDGAFWRHQASGVAVFVAPDLCRFHKVPLPLREDLVIDRRFQIRPLLPVLANDGRFFLLTLSMSRMRLFEGSKFSLEERQPDDLPEGVRTIVGRTQFENAIDFHPTGPAETTTGTPTAKYHSLGDSAEESWEKMLTEFLHEVSGAIDEYLSGTQAPLLLAADEPLEGHFRKINKYRGLVEDSIPTNPDALSDAELHDRAYAIMKPVFEGVRRGALDQFHALAGDGADRVATGIAEIAPHAHFGRVDVAFLAEDSEAWGQFDEAAAAIELHDARQPGDAELLNEAAIQTLLHGGGIFTLAGDAVPGGGAAAAILRY